MTWTARLLIAVLAGAYLVQHVRAESFAREVECFMAWEARGGGYPVTDAALLAACSRGSWEQRVGAATGLTP
jgi:hypothetical protein